MFKDNFVLGELKRTNLKTGKTYCVPPRTVEEKTKPGTFCTQSVIEWSTRWSCFRNQMKLILPLEHKIDWEGG
jgi:hypothetical protein